MDMPDAWADADPDGNHINEAVVRGITSANVDRLNMDRYRRAGISWDQPRRRCLIFADDGLPTSCLNTASDECLMA